MTEDKKLTWQSVASVLKRAGFTHIPQLAAQSLVGFKQYEEGFSLHEGINNTVRVWVYDHIIGWGIADQETIQAVARPYIETLEKAGFEAWQDKYVTRLTVQAKSSMTSRSDET